MAPLPPNPDTIIYPPGNPQLIISVAQDPPDYPLDAVPLDLYIEKFLLKDNVTPVNNNDKKPTRLGLFTHEFTVALKSDSGQRLSLGIPGINGGKHILDPLISKTATLVQNGYPGGIVDFYAEDLDTDTANLLLLNASGGTGYTPLDKPDAKNGDNGGNGGAGGQVSIVFSSPTTVPIRLAQRLLADLESNKHFPAGFETGTADLIAACKTPDVEAVTTLSTELDALKAALKGSSDTFRDELINIFLSLKTVDDEVYSALTQTPLVTRGYAGRGSHGSVKNGANGTPGADGHYSVHSVTDGNKVWNFNVCFAHPVQCQMLLDMAKLYFYVDGDTDLAKSKLFLERLGSRLAFLESKPSNAESDPALVKAYRDAEERLFIPSGPENDEPASIKSLRAIKKEAASVLSLLNSGKDFYGHDRNYVPRRTFDSYDTIIKQELQSVKDAEESYTAYRNAANEASKKRDYIDQSRSACQAGQTANKAAIENAKEDMADNIIKIDSLTPSLKAASQDLQEMTQLINMKIKNGFKVPTPQLIEALGQVVMAPSRSMFAVQGANVIDQGIEDIPNDAGVQINKNYLIKQVQNISGNLDSLYEGYQVSKDGKVDLLDPGAAKLQLAEGQLTTLLSDYENALPMGTMKDLKAKFKSYVDIVLKRNAAVVRYDAALLLIIKAATENAALEQTMSNLAHMEVAAFEMDNPMMTVAMKNAYLTSVKDLQSWLYLAQRAYNFQALDSTNIMASFFNTIDTSQYTYALLEQAQRSLYNAYSEYLNDQKNPRMPFPTIRYTLEKDDIDAIRRDGKDGTLHLFSIPTPDNDDRVSPFRHRSDVRLTTARVFLPGAKTANGLLYATLKHMGDETMVDPTDREITFTHDTINVPFQYKLASGKYEDGDAFPGEIGKAGSGYALVGPFATWQLEVKNDKDFNDGLDLSKVESVYIEFEGECRYLN